jgi:hypothetical protein
MENNALKDLDFNILESALNNNNDSNNDNNQDDNIQDVNLDNDNEDNNNLPPDDLGNDGSSSDNNSPLHLFAKVLQEEGFFSEEDLTDYDGTIDTLVDKVANYANKIAESKLSGYTPEAQKYITLLNKGLNEEEAMELTQKAFELEKVSVDSLSVDEAIQENIVTLYLKETGLSDDDIEDQIEYLKDQDKLKSKAINFLDKLKERRSKEEEAKVERAKAEKENQVKKYEEDLSNLKKRVFETKEFIPGMEVTDKMKEKIYQKITTPAKVENGVPISHVGLKRMKDPIQFEITLNLLDELGVFDGKFDKLLNAGKRKSVEELTNSIQSSDFFNKSTNKSTPGDKAKEILQSFGSIPTMKI